MANRLHARIFVMACSLAIALACASSGSENGTPQATDSTTSGDGDGNPSTGDGDGDGDPSTGDGDPGTGDGDGDGDQACTQEVAAINLTTDDGVELIADLYIPGQSTGTVVLLHMIPPNDKSNFPAPFIALLAEDHGLNVINVNRRGAPGSGGEAADGYLGDKAHLDAKAAIDYMSDHACANGTVMIVGASNGSTGALDMALYASQQPGYEPPARMVFMSAGTYTENQTSLEANLDTLGLIPILFAYPAGEAAWNEAVQVYAPPAWSFVEYAGGTHGTGLFSSNPESLAAVADYVAGL